MSLCPIIFKDEQSVSTNDRPGYPGHGSGSGRVSMSFVTENLKRLGVYMRERLNQAYTMVSRKKRDRMLVAQQRDLSPEQIQSLINDPSPLVRMELAWNKSLSPDVLRKLIRDPDHTVSTIARRRLIKATDEFAVPDIL